MATKEQLEVYRQLCESFRFQYRQEWQLLQVGAAIGLGLFALGVEKENCNHYNWRFLASGLVFLGFAYAMYRMSKGNQENRPRWVHYARVVGDSTVKELGPPWKSAAVWGRWILCVLGVAGVCFGIWSASFLSQFLQLILSGLVVLILRTACIDCEGYHRKRSNIVLTASIIDAICIGLAAILLLLGMLFGLGWLYETLSFQSSQ